MKGVKIISIVTLVVAVAVLGVVIWSHQKNKTSSGSSSGSPSRSVDFNDILE